MVIYHFWLFRAFLTISKGFVLSDPELFTGLAIITLLIIIFKFLSIILCIYLDTITNDIYSSLCHSLILNRLELQLLLKSYNMIFLSRLHILDTLIHTKKIFICFYEYLFIKHTIVFDGIITTCSSEIYFEENINMQEMIELLENRLEIN